MTAALLILMLWAIIGTVVAFAFGKVTGSC